MVDYRFGFTGTQHGMTDAQKATLRDFLAAGSGEFHHGDCIGADSEAHDIADECGYSIVSAPADKSGKAGLARRAKSYDEAGEAICRPQQGYRAGYHRAHCGPCGAHRAATGRNVVNYPLWPPTGPDGHYHPARRKDH